MNPVVILIIGVALLIAMIIVLRVNAFVALITAAIIISLLAPGDLADKVSRVAEAFGSVVGAIGIVIALAAVIGKCLMDSGAADRIVRSFLKALGEKRASVALMGSGFVLSVPVFFDTVFYLLVPLARSLWRRTQKNYVLYLTAIVAGAGITHTLVPPTPGPLFMANSFNVDLGVMIGMGILVGLPTAALGLFVCKLINRFVDIPMRPYVGESEPEPLDDDQLPGFWISVSPIILPVVLISINTVTKALDMGGQVAQITAVLGNPNLALLFSAAIAMFVLIRSRGLSLKELSGKMDTALMSGGIIILITAGGGAFGAMLRAAGVQDAVKICAGLRYGGHDYDRLNVCGYGHIRRNAGLQSRVLSYGYWQRLTCWRLDEQQWVLDLRADGRSDRNRDAQILDYPHCCARTDRSGFYTSLCICTSVGLRTSDLYYNASIRLPNPKSAVIGVEYLRPL